VAEGNQLVLAFFESEESADRAVGDLKAWDRASDDIKLGAVGVLVKDQNGKIKTHKLGSRAGGKGARTGIILGVIAAILSGGVTLLGGVVGGALGGGLLGSLFHRGLGLSEADYSRIGKELDQGHAAVGIVVSSAEAAGVSAKLRDLGGRPEGHEVSDEAVGKATEALQAARAESGSAEPTSPEATTAEKQEPTSGSSETKAA